MAGFVDQCVTVDFRVGSGEVQDAVGVGADEFGMVTRKWFWFGSGVLDKADEMSEVLGFEELLEAFGHEAARLSGERTEVGTEDGL